MKALLVSLPWAYHRIPSLQIGLLAAYARERGFDVESRHLHLEVAANFGIQSYDDIADSKGLIKDVLFALFLFPEKKRQILKYLHKHMEKPELVLKRLLKSILKVYQNIHWEDYKLVGFTLHSDDQLFSSLLFAKWLKLDFPEISVVFGGSRVSGKMGISLLKCFPQVDWCVDGEGEIAFEELLRCISDGTKNVESRVPGLIHRKGRLIKANPRKQLPNLNDLPDPEFYEYFEVLNNHPLLRDKEIMAYMPVEGSRGCPNNCAFCPIHAYWDDYRVRNPKIIAAQLNRQAEKYRILNFIFIDSVIPQNNLDSLCSIIERQRRDYRIFYEIRAGINKGQVASLQRAGIRRVQIGIEAFSTNLLCKINKGTRVIENLQTMKYCEEIGIEHASNILIKFPTESQKDINEMVHNMEYAMGYRPPDDISTFSLLEGSKVCEQSNSYGIAEIIKNVPQNKLLLPANIRKYYLFFIKRFKSRKRPRDYRNLRELHKKWQSAYDESRLNNQPLLSYYDCGSFLRIEDYRSGERSIILEGDARDLYLFCDSIRCLYDIKKRFPKWAVNEIRKVLNKLVESKVMFKEENDYLSLSIHSNKYLNSDLKYI